MPTMMLKSSLFVARAAQLTSDSIGVIDLQIDAVAGIHVDPAVVPGLVADLGGLRTVLAQWPNALRQTIIVTLRRALSDDTGILGGWARIARNDQGSLLDFAKAAQGVVTSANGLIAELSGRVLPFRTAIDHSVSALGGDLKKVSDQLSAEQQLVQSVEQQVRNQQERIEYYRDHPWQLFLDGLSIVGLIKDLTDLIDASNQARAALSRLQQVEPQLQQLSAARGPLLALSAAATGLGGGVSNMQTAVAQIASKLGGILQEPPLPAILAAQLNEIVEDLSAADGIISEILTGS